ncbi:MAG TPA: MFS transporter [Thermodesulfovibrionia bacterium]|nr:MFS transporter [Thermodesulfovibrionia bacterium]
MENTSVNTNRKAVWGWVIYDWANSAFATIVIAGFFPVFFKTFWSVGDDATLSTVRLGFGNSLASLVVALSAPVLGAISDRGQSKKTFLALFSYLGVLMTAGLFWVPEGDWFFSLFLFAFGVAGFSWANIFYDALLPSVAGNDTVDYVSGLGYAMGYLGGGLLFLVNVAMTLYPNVFGLSSASEAVRVSFLMAALWWGFFTAFTLLWVREPKGVLTQGGSVSGGISQVIVTFKKIRNLKTTFLFLLAYWLYIDGVDTVIRMAVDYGISIGLSSTHLIAALLITQFVGFPSALFFGNLGARWSVKGSVFIAIGAYVVITVWGTLMTSKEEFYILASVVGLFQGGIQALSRSYYSRLVPQNLAGEFFGFYNMLGKFAAIFGPALIGGTGLAAQWLLMPDSPTQEQFSAYSQLASRIGMGSLLILFLGGGVLLYFVDEEQGKKEAANLEKEMAGF